MPTPTPVTVRIATESDVDGVRETFLAAYGEDYPYRQFFDPEWLKRSVFSDDILMLVAIDPDTDDILGTASVVLDIGAHSDLLGEFGRLVVHPGARGRGVGLALMDARVKAVEGRLHVGLVENRTAHPYSQLISIDHGFAPVGFLPLRHEFGDRRESIAMFVRHFGVCLSLRNNHPRVVPEAHALAHIALMGCGLPDDAIVDDESPSYSVADQTYALEDLTAHGLPALMRIERGRVRNRDVFGPMRLQYGFFKLTTNRANYIIARPVIHGTPSGDVAGAIGYIHDPIEHSLRVFELISRTDSPIRDLLRALMKRCDDLGVQYVEVDVSAHAPRMQRTFLELGFFPCAYIPAMVFHDVERLDVIKMVRLLIPPVVDDAVLSEPMLPIAQVVMTPFRRDAVQPEVQGAMGDMSVFAGLGPEQAGRLAGMFTVHRFNKGDVLFTEGQKSGGMYIIIDGQVIVQNADGTKTYGEVGAGECLGEVSLLTQNPHSATTTALGDTIAARLTPDQLKALLRLRPDIAVHLYKNLAVDLSHKLTRADRAMSESGTEPSAEERASL